MTDEDIEIDSNNGDVEFLNDAGKETFKQHENAVYSPIINKVTEKTFIKNKKFALGLVIALIVIAFSASLVFIYLGYQYKVEADKKGPSADIV